LVDKDTLTPTELSQGEFLDYTIRFQNTGNDTAFTVRIINPIDTNNFQLSTIEFTASSHPVHLEWIPWERNMKFSFENILLPDSNVNEILSHGFVRYRIKPKNTLQAGDSVSNHAAIYFDYNPPVLTNTAVTHIATPLSVESIPSQLMHIFPNPCTSYLTIETSGSDNDPGRLSLFNLCGQRMAVSGVSTPWNGNMRTTLDVSTLPRGIYFLSMPGQQSKTIKIVVM
jgi:uncharacterized repeat protein (TIGR01451 family)